MHLVVISHKTCWRSPSGYLTDGGFPVQMEAISELFSQTTLLVPCSYSPAPQGVSPLAGRRSEVLPLTVPGGKGIWRKLGMFTWFVRNCPTIIRAVVNADAVHAPIPGDVGTIGILAALAFRKRLFVRHCGNWLEPRTFAERAWKRGMELFAGSRNVMFATGGSTEPPSTRNANIEWIFSTSLRRKQLAAARPKTLPDDGAIRLIIACRQEEKKGTDVVIKSLPQILEKFPGAILDVVGDGSTLDRSRALANSLGVENSVRFHGKVVQSKVLGLLGSAHLFCYPTSASEGFPKAVLEALSCGLPIVTTPVSVLPQLVGNGCGAILQIGSANALAEAVINILSDGICYKEMSATAIETAQNYSLENWRDRIGMALRTAWKVESLDRETGMLRRQEQQ